MNFIWLISIDPFHLLDSSFENESIFRIRHRLFRRRIRFNGSYRSPWYAKARPELSTPTENSWSDTIWYFEDIRFDSIRLRRFSDYFVNRNVILICRRCLMIDMSKWKWIYLSRQMIKLSLRLSPPGLGILWEGQFIENWLSWQKNNSCC